MSVALASEALDLALARVGAGRLNLAFLGGEPLLAVERLEEIVSMAADRCARQGATLWPCITTNGTVFTPKALALLAGRGFDVTVSFDGVRRAHDSVRPFLDGRGSHAATVAGIRQALAAGIRTGVNLVANPATLDLLASGAAEAIEAGVRRLEINPNFDADWREADLAELGRQYEAIADLAIAAARANRPVQLSYLDTALAGMVRPREACTFGRRELAVDPRGRVFPCERLIRDDESDLHVLGRLPGELDPATLDAGCAARRPVPAECEGCTLVSACRGGCPCINFSRTGSYDRPDGLVCAVEAAAASAALRALRCLSVPSEVLS